MHNKKVSKNGGNESLKNYNRKTLMGHQRNDIIREQCGGDHLNDRKIAGSLHHQNDPITNGYYKTDKIISQGVRLRQENKQCDSTDMTL